MIKYPLIYLYLYCKLRSKNNDVICSKLEFRQRLSQPLGINKRLSEFILRDLQRYNMIRSISYGRNGKIEFKNPNDDADLFKDLVELRKVGLI